MAAPHPPSTFPLKVAVASICRTPVGRALKGTLRHTRPEDLAAAAMVEAVRRVPGLRAEDVEDVALGCAMPEAEQGLNIARNAVFAADFPDSVSGQTVNRFCSSGLQALADAALTVHAGLSEVVIGGGVESMSMVPMSGNKVSLNPALVDRRPEVYIGMGHTAERVAKLHGVSRVDQDAFAARSHANATAAIKAGRFVEEIVAVKARRIEGGKVSFVDFSVDESPRADTSAEVLAKLRPAFSTKGSVTAGNASPLNDGAAAGVLLSEAKVAALGITPIAYLVGFAVAGVPPDIMGVGPVPAIQKVLKLCGLTVGDIDRFEINEAFAAQALHCQRELKIPLELLNPDGGGIAIGHPLGCTGARIAATLIYGLRREAREKKRPAGPGYLLGVESMCIGGGMGAAAVWLVPT